MFPHRLRVRRSAVSGLTRTEVIFLIAVVATLLIVGLGPVRSYFYAHGVARGVESAKALDTLLAQYATDNNEVYPAGEGTRAPGTSEGIALDLLQNQFTPNADIFAVGATPRYAGTAPDYADFTAANISWDFTAGETATTGITTNAPDLLPILYTTGEEVDYAKARGHGLTLQPSGKGPFGRKGIVVAYKSGAVLFIPAHPGGGEIPSAFILSNFHDTGTYTQIKP